MNSSVLRCASGSMASCTFSWELSPHLNASLLPSWPSAILNPVLRYEGVVESCKRSSGSMSSNKPIEAFALLGLTVPGPQRKDLVVSGEKRLIETLVMRVTLLDVAQVPLAVECCRVARLRENLGERYFLIPPIPWHFEQACQCCTYRLRIGRAVRWRHRRPAWACNRPLCTCV